MILDGICYPVIHFDRAILNVWSSPPVVGLFFFFFGEYLVLFTSTFVSGRQLTSTVSTLMLRY